VIDPALVEGLTTKQVRTTRDLRRRGWRDLLTDAHYGLGWRIYTIGEEEIYLHSGWVRGFVAEVAFSRDRQVGLAVLLNAESSALNEFTTGFWRQVLAEPTGVGRANRGGPGGQGSAAGAVGTLASPQYVPGWAEPFSVTRRGSVASTSCRSRHRLRRPCGIAGLAAQTAIARCAQTTAGALDRLVGEDHADGHAGKQQAEDKEWRSRWSSSVSAPSAGRRRTRRSFARRPCHCPGSATGRQCRARGQTRNRHRRPGR
jgi:hypothetical protein